MLVAGFEPLIIHDEVSLHPKGVGSEGSNPSLPIAIFDIPILGFLLFSPLFFPFSFVFFCFVWGVAKEPSRQQ